MAIDIKGITCPQCGATDVVMTSDTRGACKVCGAQFTVQPVDEGIHIHLDGLGKQDDDGCLKAEIKPIFTKEQFLRDAWIALAAEDAPMEVFSEDFGEVQEIAHQILIHKIAVDVDCQASVGYDRQEPYIDYETYYEQEPYIDYERQYNSTRQAWEERQVTKYRKVAKQRQVTKYKTVTDWSAWSGSHSMDSIAVEENLEGRVLYDNLFVDSFTSMKKDSAVPVTGEAAAKMQVSKQALDRANNQHRNNITNSVKRIVPGDHYRDLSWQVRHEREDVSLFNTTEYVATIIFEGDEYTRRAFPFGFMTVGGDEIVNDVSLDSAVTKMQDEMKENTRKRWKAAEANTARATRAISLLTIVFLLASILVSFLIRSTFLVITMLVVAVTFFVINEIVVRKKDSEESALAYKEIQAEEAGARAEINDYSKAYKAKLLNVLNGKLQSLCLDPAEPYELGDFDDEDLDVDLDDL